MPTGKLKTLGRAGWCGWERLLRLEMHFPIKPYFSMSALFFSVMSNEPGKNNEMSALKGRDNTLSSVIEKNTKRWGKIRDIE